MTETAKKPVWLGKIRKDENRSWSIADTNLLLQIQNCFVLIHTLQRILLLVQFQLCRPASMISSRNVSVSIEKKYTVEFITKSLYLCQGPTL